MNVADDTLLEANVCPNCWGIQEYDHQFKQFVEDQTKANINHDKTHHKAFVQQFVETYVTGIHLKNEGEERYCPTCHTRYKHLPLETD
ncbi:MAG: hypothetical protein DA408_11960 [Bacteroidetes bacterium]|nr:MAG: hypothetical protein C7N36_16970 [Bacteroidota bacterium]PTM12077.1 MAG: hypothetical protein DA408_11960 [Bacteroidota bacterium]